MCRIPMSVRVPGSPTTWWPRAPVCAMARRKAAAMSGGSRPAPWAARRQRRRRCAPSPSRMSFATSTGAGKRQSAYAKTQPSSPASSRHSIWGLRFGCPAFGPAPLQPCPGWFKGPQSGRGMIPGNRIWIALAPSVRRSVLIGLATSLWTLTAKEWWRLSNSRWLGRRVLYMAETRSVGAAQG